MITSILKALIVLVCILSTIWFLILGLRGNKTGYKKTGLSVILTFVVVNMFTIIEHRIHSKKPTLLLSASREAPIGGIWLKLYGDTSYTLTYDPRSEGIKGIYKIKEDTLTIFNADTIKASFIIREKLLEELGTTGIGGLTILKN